MRVHVRKLRERETKMLINNEQARINYLPESRLFAWLETYYTDEVEFRVNGNPHEETVANILADMENDQLDPLDHDWNGLEDSDLTALWSDLAYPLPSEVDELANDCYGVTPSDIAREALKEYARMFDIEPVAQRVLDRLREEWNGEQQNV